MRDTIEILKDSANRAAEDSRRYDLQCQDTISALKFALGLRDIKNSKAGDGAVEVSPKMPAPQSIAPNSEGRERGLVSRRRGTMETGRGPIRGIKVAPIGGGPNKFPKNSTRATGGCLLLRRLGTPEVLRTLVGLGVLLDLKLVEE